MAVWFARINQSDPLMTSGSAQQNEFAVASQSHSFQAYRAPREHGQCLIEPAINQAGELLAENQSRLDAYPQFLSRLRETARTQLIRDAKRYTSAYRDSTVQYDGSQPIVMAGHQPALFHPGVWFKNFALHRVAADTNAVAINLVVDSDVAPASSVRVPQFDAESGGIGFSSVQYDRRGSGVPYEQALIEDRQLFDSFGDNVASAVKGLVDEPAAVPLWDHAREAINRCGFAGCALAQARHRLESELGLQTLEIPQSVVCRGQAFAAFVMHILCDLPRFHQCYNESTDFYRSVHSIRSNAHPVPNLGRQEDWYEAPLWIYGNQTPKRRSLWVRQISGGRVIEISDRQNVSRRIDCADNESAAEAFVALASPEFKVRSRALLTTMFARLVLSDLFLHGIGGGKYDQLGDLISRSYWEIDPPQFMVMSATVLLPGHESYSLDQIDLETARHHRQLRDIQFQGERFADRADLPQEWVEQKKALIAEVPPRGQRYQWRQRVNELNEKMAAALSEVREEIMSQRQRLVTQRREASIWNSREHSFCVYPLDYLTDAYDKMLAGSSST